MRNAAAEVVIEPWVRGWLGIASSVSRLLAEPRRDLGDNLKRSVGQASRRQSFFSRRLGEPNGSIYLTVCSSTGLMRGHPLCVPKTRCGRIGDEVRSGGIQQYYNGTRTHLSLAKDSPVPRSVHATGSILPLLILGGFHHHYVRI